MKTRLLLLLLHVAAFVAAQHGLVPDDPESHRHALISFENPDRHTLHILQQAGIDLHCGGHHAQIHGTDHLHIECSPYELRFLQRQGISYSTEIADLSSFYAQRAQEQLPLAKTALAAEKLQSHDRALNDTHCASPEYTVPQHFRLGEMGGFLYYEEILAVLDSMHLLYPHLVTVRRPLHPVMRTHERREISFVKITNAHSDTLSKPEVLHTALTHAREPASAMSMLFYMWYLLENYDHDAEVQRIVDHTALYFIPVLNPDGYIRNETIAPQGGGMWRKNLRDNDNNGVIDGKDGVDLNRNFGFLWGLDNDGSSQYPVSNTYRGPEPFSEPETQMLRAFVQERTFVAAMHNHSYGNDLYHPWEHGVLPLPDADLFYRISDLMTWDNRYLFGESHSTYWLGKINGGANDWFYGEQDEKPKIYSWLAEIGEVFWPAPQEIVRICKQQMEPHLMLARVAGQYVKIHDLNPATLSPYQHTLTFRIENLGLRQGDLQVRIVSDDDMPMRFQPTQFQITPMEILETTEFEITIDPEEAVMRDGAIAFDIVIEGEDYTIARMHIVKELDAVVLFHDELVSDTLAAWISDTWGVYADESCPHPVCIADSPDGDQLNAYTTITLREPLDLSEVAWAMAAFDAKWSIETTHDFVQLQARTEGGNWTAVCGMYTKPGATGNQIDYPSPHAGQPSGEPVYDGRQATWVHESANLTAFVGQHDVSLRFIAWSGGLVSHIVEDGFAFSGFKVYTSRKSHCSDGLHNHDEEDVDCGGTDCAPCQPTCNDGVQNGDETGVDCGGSVCAPCEPTCNDGIMNGDEEDIDCGGSCPDPCKSYCCERDNKLWYDDSPFDAILSPNPVHDQLILDIVWPEHREPDILTWHIMHPAGYSVLQGRTGAEVQHHIDISALVPQLYALRLSDATGKSVVKRFVKL